MPRWISTAQRTASNAREFHQHAVAGRLDDAAVVLGDRRIDALAPVRLQLRERAFLVRAHATAVPHDISREDRCHPVVHLLPFHDLPPRAARHPFYHRREVERRAARVPHA
jgi:hypothetical protein